VTVNAYDPDSVRRLISAHHADRMREADAERLARELRSTSSKHRWLHLTAGVALRAGRRARALTSIPRPSHP
jgi:hypothetical protein